jgi:hypothetical protein
MNNKTREKIAGIIAVILFLVAFIMFFTPLFVGASGKEPSEFVSCFPIFSIGIVFFLAIPLVAYAGKDGLPF